MEEKAGAAPGPGDFRGLVALQDAVGAAFHRGIPIHTGRKMIPFGPKRVAVPVQALWEPGARPVGDFVSDSTG